MSRCWAGQEHSGGRWFSTWLVRRPTATATYRQVALVADEHDRHVRVGVLPCVLQPARQVVERLAPMCTQQSR